MNRHIIFFSLALGVTSLQPLEAATPNDSGYYVSADAGVNFERGKVRLDVGPDVFDRVPTNQHDVIGGIAIGEQLTRHFALELGYRELADISGSLVNAPGSPPATGSFRFSAGGPTIALVWRVPFGRWEADFKLGSVISESHLSLGVSDRFGTIRASTWNPGLLAQVGVGYRLTNQWTVSLNRASYSDIGRNGVTGRWSIRATSIGIAYHF